MTALELQSDLAIIQLSQRRAGLYRAEAAHKAGQTEETLAELVRARRLYGMGLVRVDRLRQGKRP